MTPRQECYLTYLLPYLLLLLHLLDASLTNSCLYTRSHCDSPPSHHIELPHLNHGFYSLHPSPPGLLWWIRPQTIRVQSLEQLGTMGSPRSPSLRRPGSTATLLVRVAFFAFYCTLGIRDARADEKEQMRECAPTPQAWSQAFHGHWYDHSDRTRRQCRNTNVQVGWAAPNNGPVTYNNGASNGNSYKPPQQMQQQGNNSQYTSGPDQQPYYAGGGGGQASEYYNSNSAPAYDGVAQPGTYQAPSYPPPAQTR